MVQAVTGLLNSSDDIYYFSMGFSIITELMQSLNDTKKNSDQMFHYSPLERFFGHCLILKNPY